MQTNLPIGLFAIIVSLYIFYTYNRKIRLRRKERRESLNNHRKEYLNQLIQSKVIAEAGDQKTAETTGDKAADL